MGCFGTKTACRHNSGSTKMILLEYCIMEGANKYMKVVIMVFPKNVYHFGKMGCFKPENNMTL